jgi:hypothetical protein
VSEQNDLDPTPAERWIGEFLTGLGAAQAGQRGLPAIETPSGPIEGTPTPDGVRFDLPDGRVFEVWADPKGGTRFVLDGKQVARFHPVTVEPDDETDG